MDVETPHAERWGHIRLLYIFRLYDVNKDDIMKWEEFLVLMRHLARVNHTPHDKPTVIAHASKFCSSNGSITLRAFVNAVKTGKLRGTSRLFRFAHSPFVRVRSPNKNITKPVQTSPQHTGSAAANEAPSSTASSTLPQYPASPQTWPSMSPAPPTDGARALLASPMTTTDTSDHTAISVDPVASPTRTTEMSDNKYFVTPPRSSRRTKKKTIISPQAIAVSASTGWHAASADADPVVYRRVVELKEALIPPPPKQFSNAADKQLAQRALRTAKHIVHKLVVPKNIPKPPAKFDLVPLPELSKLCEYVTRRCLAREPPLVEIEAPAKVFGDIHSQLEQLLDMFRAFGSPNHYSGDINLVSYVFNGDFVDRGIAGLRFGIEVVCLLFAIKAMYPGSVVLVRGNHEDRQLNSRYGFLEECIERCGEADGRKLWEIFNIAFDWLPFGALINKSILCVHGGIGHDLQSLDELRAVKRPVSNPQAHQMFRDVLWSDPNTHDSVLGVHASGRGEGIATFDVARVTKFCEANNLDTIIRSHQCVEGGYEFFAGGRMITVFSATNYCGKLRNAGAMLEISFASKGAGFEQDMLRHLDDSDSDSSVGSSTGSIEDGVVLPSRKNKRKPLRILPRVIQPT
jgi:diadenosine tetraphosphatase ApaH/serine/threonine PP2A family protein phosphatase